ncbi:Nucleoside-specific channel-forming protein, Tsx [Roseovarius albus]|uniref:Nucleoside-specific channel-forming protein, Tsx n=1 Tax=Roseovarius albus TaxID=1247867 RepID=A0A1X6ZEB6_9RHOB|nr:DUF5020 family protein [Roseovarius albus]SLN49152.1 Nucleoside-specific channel-forming protein, Tsx [Roseovarius albus]
MKRLLGNFCAGAVVIAGLASATPVQANFSETEIQLHYGEDYKLGRNANFPDFDNTTSRQTITLEHFSTNDIGDLFFFVDFFQDNDKLEDDSGTESDQYGEIYYHLHGSQFGLNFGDSSPVSGLDLGVGLNQGTDFSVALAGPRLNFGIEGFRVLSLGVYAYNNFVDPFSRNLDTTYQATLVWDYPFAMGKQKFLMRGFVDFIGDQGSGVEEQIVFSPQFRWDLGNAIKLNEDKLYLGVEYTHFNNKFGVEGVDENSYSLFVSFKF